MVDKDKQEQKPRVNPAVLMARNPSEAFENFWRAHPTISREKAEQMFREAGGSPSNSAQPALQICTCETAPGIMKLPRRKFLYLAAGAAALPSVSRVAWAQA